MLKFSAHCDENLSNNLWFLCFVKEHGQSLKHKKKVKPTKVTLILSVSTPQNFQTHSNNFVGNTRQIASVGLTIFWSWRLKGKRYEIKLPLTKKIIFPQESVFETKQKYFAKFPVKTDNLKKTFLTLISR